MVRAPARVPCNANGARCSRWSADARFPVTSEHEAHEAADRCLPTEESPVDIRIGVIHSLKEIEVELPDDADREDVRRRVDEVMADESKTLWLTDRFGREVAVPASKVAYVELGRPDAERRIGFGS